MVLKGKVALVSGASCGIGRAIAEALAEAGSDVALNYFSDPEEAEQVAAKVRSLGCRAALCHGDVADAATAAGFVNSAVRELGPIDIAVSCAAFSERAPFFEADVDRFRRTIDVTMWGAFHLFRATARQMISQGWGGTIVGISSPHAYLPVPNSMAYNMATAALDQMAQTAAIELISHRIRVNLVHPGWVDTPGERTFTSDSDIDDAAKLPWGRLGTPEEIARAVVFLCDPASDYVTGSSILVDGATTLQGLAQRSA